MLYLGYVLLRYVLIYNLEVSFNFQGAVKTALFLTPGFFLRAPDNLNFFRFLLKVRVIGSRLYIPEDSMHAGTCTKI